MTFAPPMFAQVTEIPAGAGASKTATFILSDMMMLFVALGVILLGVLIWAVVIRGPKQQVRARRIYKQSHSHHHQEGDEEDEAEEEEAASGSKSHRKRKKKRVRRREHRGRNPTLAETGGLPDPRPPGVPPTI